MSKDPYHEVAAEVQGALQTADTLLSSYMRIRSTARSDSEELAYARNEVRSPYISTNFSCRSVHLTCSSKPH